MLEQLFRRPVAVANVIAPPDFPEDRIPEVTYLLGQIADGKASEAEVATVISVGLMLVYPNGADPSDCMLTIEGVA